MKPKSTILFFMPDFEGGGAQRVVVNILNHLDRDRYNLDLVVNNATGPYKDLLKFDVKLIELKKKRIRNCIWSLKKIIDANHPDLVFAVQMHANIVAALAVKISKHKPLLILRETNHLTTKGLSPRSLSGRLLTSCYRSANRIVSLSLGVADDIVARSKLARDKISTIYNPMDIESIRNLSEQPILSNPLSDFGSGRFIEIISVGRLVPQKGFDLLIKAIAHLKRPNIRLTILGEGECRTELESLIEEYNLKDNVLLPGFQKNPFPWFKKADLFVLSSRWEGFGNVIVEAMICGVPVIATDCPSGPNEIIQDRVNGILCEPNNVTDLALSIQKLADDAGYAKKLAQAALLSAEKFSIENIVSQYAKMFEDCEKNNARKKN